MLKNSLGLTSAAFTLIIVVSAPASAVAQDRLQVSGGYQFGQTASGTTVSGTAFSGTTFPMGWFADAALRLGVHGLSVVTEVTGAYKNASQVSSPSPSISVTHELRQRQHTVMGGIRYDLSTHGRSTPFVQTLVGVRHASSESSSSAAFIPSSDTSSDDTTWGVGGGMRFALNAKWATRIGIGYRRVMKADLTSNGFQVTAGLVR